MKLYTSRTEYVLDMYKKKNGKTYHFTIPNLHTDYGFWEISIFREIHTMDEVTSDMKMHDANRKEFDRHCKELFYNDILNEETK